MRTRCECVQPHAPTDPQPHIELVRYLHDTDPPVLELSRRNLMALLAKLDDPASARTLLTPGAPGDPVLVVRAVEDAEHYADRPAGEVYMPTYGFTWDQPGLGEPTPDDPDAPSD